MWYRWYHNLRGTGFGYRSWHSGNYFWKSGEKKLPDGQAGMATAGFICGIVAIVVAVIVMIVVAVMFAAVATGLSYYDWMYY